ncbi:MAG: Zn-dependent protease [Candidatus Aminicenantes bacterium RBG_13_63_10]|nr:MAG: Zn-dependent protease [Candidatus Aminicenantes bacterium RBG_13_63_10]
MRSSVVILAAALAFAWASLLQADSARPVHTYSIVAYDKATGELGVAVQSHWFSVGALVPWAESGVGAVATQSFVEVSYGPLALEMMRAGKTPVEALAGLLEADPNESVRQVAVIDGRGRATAHTGKKCIPEAGHYIGDGFSCQANLMLKNTVWTAMAKAYESAPGELVDRMLAALEAAEAEGGDIRGRQSAAILVVQGKSSGVWWKDRLYDLRVEDHPDPVAELKRLVRLNKAYKRMNNGDDFLTAGKVEAAMAEYAAAMAMVPDSAEMAFWTATTLASLGKVEESLPLFSKAFSLNPQWAVLLPRLSKVGQFPDDPPLIQKILELAPKTKSPGLNPAQQPE